MSFLNCVHMLMVEVWFFSGYILVSTFGWFHFKIARKIGGCVCILDVIILGSTSNEHGSFAFEVICLKVLSTRVKKLLDCVCKISLLLLCFSGVVCQGLFRCWLLCGILPILLITSLCVWFLHGYSFGLQPVSCSIRCWISLSLIIYCNL